MMDRKIQEFKRKQRLALDATKTDSIRVQCLINQVRKSMKGETMTRKMEVLKREQRLAIGSLSAIVTMMATITTQAEQAQKRLCEADRAVRIQAMKELQDDRIRRINPDSQIHSM